MGNLLTFTLVIASFIWAGVFVILWFIGIVSILVGMYYSVKLGKRLNKIDPSIIYSSFPFLTIRAINRTSKNFSKAAFGMLNVAIHFGSKEAIEKWFDNFMEVNKIKNLKDKETQKYFQRNISLMSLFIRAWVMMMVGMAILLSLLFLFLP